LACACLRREAALSYQDKHTPRLQIDFFDVLQCFDGGLYNQKVLTARHTTATIGITIQTVKRPLSGKKKIKL